MKSLAVFIHCKLSSSTNNVLTTTRNHSTKTLLFGGQSNIKEKNLIHNPQTSLRLPQIVTMSTTPVAKRLQGKVALITGGASGIGESTARLYVKHGAKVLVADIQDELGNSLCQQLGSEETISYIHCDVTCDTDVQNAVDLAVSKYGKLDIMFNNAGINMPTVKYSSGARILATESDDFKRIMDVNLFGAFYGARHAARVMVPAKKGCILFTSSIASVISTGTTHPAYSASKHALVGLAKNLCVDLGQYGIRVNCISPFATATQMVRKPLGMMEKSKVEEIVSSSANLKGVVLESDDIAEAALYLGSDESKYVSGINLVVDGGYTATNPNLSIKMRSLISEADAS